MPPEAITIDKDQLDALSAGLLERLEPKLKAHFAKNEQDVKAILDARAEAEKKALDERLARFSVPGLSKDDKEVKDFNVSRLIRGVLLGDPAKHAPLEFEMCEATRAAAGQNVTKEMSTQVDSLGGFLVPAQVMQEQMIPLLQASTIALQAGVTRMPGLMGSPVQIPKITGATTAYWLGEVEAPTASDVTLGQIQMQPRDVFALATLSNRLIENSTPAADQLVRSQLARDIGLKIDLGIYSGTGVSGQPIGILNADGANSVTSFGSAAADTALNKLYDMEYELQLDNAQTVGEWCFALHPSIMQKFRKRADASTQPSERRVFGGPGSDAPPNIIGYRYFTSTQLPTDSFVLAAHAACVLGEWGTMVIAASREGTNFAKRQTQILVGMTVDVGHREPKAYCVATGVS